MIFTDTYVALAGAWAIHFVLILLCKIIYDIIPGVSQETSWTLTNITYMFGSYIMFHYVRGVPFDFNSGAYDNLNMWEQIDDGAQYTPAKKFLLTVPIMLFLLSTHYTHYDLTYFTINFLALLGVIVPKLPFVSRAGLVPAMSSPKLDGTLTYLVESSDAFWYILRWPRGLNAWILARRLCFLLLGTPEVARTGQRAYVSRKPITLDEGARGAK